MEQLKSLYEYDPETGSWTRLISSGGNLAGTPAGCVHPGGYIKLKIKGDAYMSHRLAWFYMTGEWPKNRIDHVNGLEGDNRWCNLREATNSENMLNRKMNKNNKTGVKGVSFDNQTQRWSVQVYYKKKNYKKRFDDFEVACEFAEFLREELHGEYARFE